MMIATLKVLEVWLNLPGPMNHARAKLDQQDCEQSGWGKGGKGGRDGKKIRGGMYAQVGVKLDCL
jgi:hypothetical protein